MSVFTTGERAHVHDATPSPDDVAVSVTATDSEPGSSLGRVLRVSASGKQASVELPGGRVVQAYRGRSSWTLADGNRTPVRWATRAAGAADPAPAPAPVSRETETASAYAPWSEADTAASEAAYLADHPAPASGDGRGVAVWAADGDAPVFWVLSPAGRWHRVDAPGSSWFLCDRAADPEAPALPAPNLPTNGAPPVVCPTCAAAPGSSPAPAPTGGELWTPGAGAWHAVTAVPGDHPDQTALCGSSVSEDALVWDRVPDGAAPCRVCARAVADRADEAATADPLDLSDVPDPTPAQLAALDAELAARGPELHRGTEVQGLSGVRVVCSCGHATARVLPRRAQSAWDEHTAHALAALRAAVAAR